jgi:hypothetical protein
LKVDRTRRDPIRFDPYKSRKTKQETKGDYLEETADDHLATQETAETTYSNSSQSHPAPAS